MDERGVRVGMRVCVVQTVDVAQKHQQVRLTKPRHNGGEGVVVAQYLVTAGFDLGGGDRVVFIHHRDHAHLQQGGKGAAQMLGPLGNLHITPRQKDLSNRAVILGKEFVIDVHHPTLAHGCGSLLHPQLPGAFGKSQLGGANGNGTGGDQDHLVPHAVQVRQSPDQMFHAPEIQRPGVVGECGSAHLDHDALLGTFCH